MASVQPLSLRLALKDVPAAAPVLQGAEDTTIRFTTVSELFEQIDCVAERGDDILVVTRMYTTYYPSSAKQLSKFFSDVSSHAFSRMEHEREARRRKFRFRRYYPSSRIAIIAIPTGPHEQLHAKLYMQFHKRLVLAGVDDSWTTMAATRHEGKGGGGGSGSGEADSSGGPLPDRDGAVAWPTLVIEAGYSESMDRLLSDMRWWFSASNHDVKIVILTKFHRRQPQPHIILQRWEEEPQAARPGATTTRSASPLIPVLRQMIAITQNSATNPPTYDVDSTTLVLSFQLLFLRNPGPGEGDFVFDIAELQDFASRVWSVVP